jgi:hypothetical protein
MTKLKTILSVLKGESVVLTVNNKELTVQAGNKNPNELQSIAATFFKSAYQLANK